MAKKSAKKKAVAKTKPAARSAKKKAARSAKPAKKKAAKKSKPKKQEEAASEAPGWDAIDEALAPIYGKQEPEHYGTIIPYSLGGPDPIRGISIYYRDKPTPHFHYVTYGFSDLYGDSDAGAEESGFGFELTFRLAAKKKSKGPQWPLHFLNNIARYVFETGNGFNVGHHVDLNGPITDVGKTDICYIAFALDPELGERDTPLGHLNFLQIVGLTRDELQLAKQWETTKVLAQLGQQIPLLVTDLKRKSMLADPRLAAKLRSAAAAEGSSMSHLYVPVAAFKKQGDRIRVTIGARGIPDLKAMLVGQVKTGGACSLIGEKHVVTFAAAKKNGWSVKENELTIQVSPQLLPELLEPLEPRASLYRWPALDKLTLEIDPTDITDDD